LHRSTAPAAPTASSPAPEWLEVPAAVAAIPNLVDDVDTLGDLDQLEGRLGPSTRRGARRAAHGSRAVRVVVLAGGLGGSRFARALAETIEPESLTIVGNVGDDLEVFGLHISPDLDTILYTLTGRLDEERGWGRRDESWNALGEAGELGADTWFQLGDRDIGLHLVRTEKLRRGEPLSIVTRELAAAFGLVPSLLPATDDRLRTWLETPAGDFPFQEWFVGRQHRDEVDGVRFEGAEDARPAPGGARGAGRSGPDRDRAEQPVRQHRPDPRPWPESARRSSSGALRPWPSAR